MIKNDPFSFLFWSGFVLRNKMNVFFFNKIIHLYLHIKGIKIGKKVKFNGLPVIRRYPQSKILIGNNCLFNSSKNSVFVGLPKRCTFVTLEKDSEIIVGNNVGMSGSIMVAKTKIKICNNIMIGANCTIFDTDFHHLNSDKQFSYENVPSKPILIEDNVFIGANCTILKGVTIGENSIIAAGSVVFNNIPKNSLAAGNPSKLVIHKNFDQ